MSKTFKRLLDRSATKVTRSTVLLGALLVACGGGGGGGGSCSPSPSINSTAPSQATVDQQYRYHFEFTMFCVTSCGVDLIEGPAGAGIDPIRNAVFWTPSQATANTSARISIATKPDPCGNRATQTWLVAVSPAPEILNFTAAQTNVARGSKTTLTATFSGTGRIEPIGPVTSGAPVITPELQVTTTFTLVVTNPVGAEVRQSISIQVPTPPAVQAFFASPIQIAQGTSTTLFWSVSGDFAAARLDPLGTDVRNVNSIAVTPANTTTYILVLTDSVGVTASASVVVDVVPMPQIRSFSASPASTGFGGTVALTAEFEGTGRINVLRDQGVAISTLGPIVSGQSITSPPLRRYSGFRLDVRDVFGRTATRDLYVEITGSGTFAASTANPLVPTRKRHSAVRLADGRVFIAGGVGERSTEIYDPSTDTFVAGPQLQISRQNHSAVLLLDGRVLLLSGAEVVFPARAKDEVFDPHTGLVAPTSWDSAGRATAVRLPDNRVFLGSPEGASLIDALATTQSPSILSGATFAGCLDAVARLSDGRVLGVFGVPTPSALFSPLSDSFTLTGAPARNRGCGFRATLAGDGRVLISGGNILPGVPAEIYDPATGLFSDVGTQQNFSSFGTGIALSNGKVLLAGGGNAFAEIFDPSTNSFSETGGMRVARAEYTATLLLDGRVFVTGGCINLPCPAEIYVPQ